MKRTKIVTVSPQTQRGEGFPSDKYDATQHTLVTDKGCRKYFCTDEKKSFTSVTDMKCITCVKDARNGINRDNGLCKTCKTGEYFSSETKDCAKAKTYSKETLLYGPNVQQNKSKPVKEQCWALSGTAYVDCVNGK